MKRVEITKANEPLSKYVRETDGSLLAITRSGKIIAGLIPMTDDDAERYSLAHNPEFQAILAESRRQYDAGKWISHEEMMRRVLPARRKRRR